MPLRTYAPNSPFLVEDTTSTIAAVMGPTGVQRLYPYSIRSTTELIAIAPAATFTSPTVDGNGGLVRLTSAGAHGLTAAVAVGKSVYITWSAGNAPSGYAAITSVPTDTSGLLFTVNLPYASSTVTVGITSVTVTFGAYNLVSGQVTASPTYGGPMVVQKSSHGLTPGAALRFTAGTSLPSPLAASTTYYVNRVLSTSEFTISTVQYNGADVYQTTATGDNGSGTFTMYPITSSLTWTSHGRSVGDQIRFTTATTLPSPLALATTYYVVKVVDANTLQIATSAGGTPIVFTDAGTGAHTATLYYGTPTVTLAGGTFTLATIPVPAGSVTQLGRMEVSVLYTLSNSANNKTFVATYGSGQTFLSTGNITGAGSIQLNKVLIPNGTGTLVTSAQAATGHGSSPNAFTTLTTNYSAAQNIVLTATIATANEWLGYEYYDIACE
jgi:hypothetical protein